jgi:inner membrane protein
VAFAYRRGWTHGLVALLFLPGLLAWAVMAFDRHVRLKRHPHAEPAKAWPILAAAIVGVVSHPAMDWLNNYGVRLLMPFDDRWFYGDALFIVDPWLWVLLGGGVMLARSRTRAAAAAWITGALAATFVLLTTPVVPFWPKAVWVAVVLGLVAVRVTLSPRFILRAAQTAAVLAAIYIAAMIAGSRAAERQVREIARARHWDVDRVAAMPVPALPLQRQVIAVTRGEYLFVPVTWTTGPAPGIEPMKASRGSYDPVVAAALEAPTVQGVRQWLRFPSFESLRRRDGTYRVVIRDARFAIGNRPGFGVVGMVDLDAQLKPLPAPRP